jgi:hypothetical protein
MKQWVIKNHDFDDRAERYLNHFDAIGQPVWGTIAEALVYDTEDLGTPIAAIAKASKPEIDVFTIERIS